MELTYRLSNFAFSSLQESLQLSHLSNWITKNAYSKRSDYGYL